MDVTERKWLAIASRALTADGGINGQIFLSSTLNFKIKQKIWIQSNARPQLQVEVRKITSPTEMEVAALGSPHESRIDLSAYTLGAASFVFAKIQDRPSIALQELNRAIYMEEPAMAVRTFNVDPFGNPYNVDNPLPVELNGEIHVDNLSVQLTSKDNDPTAGDVHDSIRIGDQNNELLINSDGSINAKVTSGTGTSRITQNISDTADAVPLNTLTTIVSYTVPAGKTSILEKISFSGENVAKFTVLVNSLIVDTKRTYWNNFNGLFDFISPSGAGYSLNAADTVQIQVIHQRPNVGDFDARIQVAESP